MIVRALDGTGDWLFGKGLQDYKRNNDAVSQNIQTRISSFLGDCFFAVNEGIDWFNLLAKDQDALNLAIGAVIINTEGVTALRQLFVNVDEARHITIVYNAQTIYSVSLFGEFTFDVATL